MRFLIDCFDHGRLVRLLFLLLLLALIPVGETYVALHVGGIWGAYLTVAAAAATGLLGLILGSKLLKNNLTFVQAKLHDGIYPRREFDSGAGIFLAAVFLIFPGFITDIIGLVCFLPGLRIGFGRILTRKMDPNLREAYEYLKLSEF